MATTDHLHYGARQYLLRVCWAEMYRDTDWDNCCVITNGRKGIVGTFLCCRIVWGFKRYSWKLCRYICINSWHICRFLNYVCCYVWGLFKILLLSHYIFLQIAVRKSRWIMLSSKIWPTWWIDMSDRYSGWRTKWYDSWFKDVFMSKLFFLFRLITAMRLDV